MSYAVSEEAIAAINNTADYLEGLDQVIKQEVARVQATFDTNRSGLGAHTASIQALLDEVAEAEEEGAIPVKKLVLKLRRAAAVRRISLENDRYAGKGRGR